MNVIQCIWKMTNKKKEEKKEAFTNALEIAHPLELKILSILRLLKIYKKLLTEQEENWNCQIILKSVLKAGQQEYSRKQRERHQALKEAGI